MVLLLQDVVMEIFVWLEVMPDQVELKCAITTHGGQCVMICGVFRMLEWCADNLVYQHHVSISTRSPNIWTTYTQALSYLSIYKKRHTPQVHVYESTLVLATICPAANFSPEIHWLYSSVFHLHFSSNCNIKCKTWSGARTYMAG